MPQIEARFDHMYTDGIPQESPSMKYRNAYGWSKLQDAVRTGYISTETANNIKASLPSGSDIRGWYYIEERDWHIFLNQVGGTDEIGVYKELECKYYRVVRDGDLDCPLELSSCRWFQMAVNVHGNCNRIKIHYSDNKNMYRVVDITDPCCELKEGSLNDTKLLKCTCIPTLKKTVLNGHGRLPNGSYRAALMLFDEDGNDTNYSITTHSMVVSDNSHRVGEVSDSAILIEAYGLPEGYTFGRLVIVEVVNGAERYRVIDRIGIGQGRLKFTYTGNEGYYEEGIAEDIRLRKRRWFKGAGIHNHNGIPIFYNIEPERNWDLQRLVNTFKVRYYRYAVPANEAKYYEGFRPNEILSFSINFNLKGGRKTKAFILSNDNVVTGGEVVTTCDGCKIPFWFANDTSKRINGYSTVEEAIEAQERKSQGVNQDFKVSASPTMKITKTDGKASSSGYGPTMNYCECFECINTLQKCYKEFMLQIIIFLNCITSAINFVLDFISGDDGSGWSCPTLALTDATDDCSCDKVSKCASLRAEANARSTVDRIVDETYLDNNEDIIEFREGERNNPAASGADESQFTYLKSEWKCGPDYKDGDFLVHNQITFKCIGGYWHYVNGSHIFEPHPAVNFDNKNIPLALKERALGRNGNSHVAGDENDEDCIPIRTKPIYFSHGCFGYAESEELYPETISRLDCEKMYGDLAGKPVRHFRVPSSTKEVHFASTGSNVESHLNPANNVLDNTWVILTGLSVEGIEIPDELQPYLCENQPFDINQAPLLEAEKTVLNSGILHGTFEGPIYGETHLHPKHGVNSPEFYDPAIQRAFNNSFRRGSASTVPAYILQSPDVMLYRNRMDAHFWITELEVYGQGIRYGHYANGLEPEKSTIPRFNQAGVRQGVNLNKSTTAAIGETPIFRCIKGMQFVEADGSVGTTGEFTYRFNNKWRESGMYIEFEGDKDGFSDPFAFEYGSTNGGDDESDTSFIGDGIDHFALIPDARAWYGSSLRFLPRQYGAVANRTYVPLGLSGTKLDYHQKTGIVVQGIVGSSSVGDYSYKRTSVLSDKVHEEISTNPSFGIVANFLDNLGIEIPDFMNPFIEALDAFFNNLLGNIGFIDCGTVPHTGDENDVRNRFNLRPGMRGITDTTGYTVTAPAQGEWADVFFPSALSTFVNIFVPSDAKLGYRGTGSIQLRESIEDPSSIAEVFYRKLKTLFLDSSFPNGANWRLSWMNRFFKKLIEPPRWKVLLRVLLNILWKFGIGFYLIIEGIDHLSENLANTVLGPGSTSVTSAIGIAIGVFLILLGLAWIIFWAGNDLMTKVFDRLLQLDGCYPDIENGQHVTAAGGSKWQMKLGEHLRGLEDNYYYYNIDYNVVNWLEVIFGIPVNYDTEWCPEEYSTDIIAGQMQNPKSHINAWRNVRTDENFSIPRTRGAITRMVTRGDRLFAHTTDSLIQIRIDKNGRFIDNTDLFGGVETGYAGNKDPNASANLPDGYWWWDRDARRPYRMSNGIQEQPFTGMEDYFDCNWGLNILEHWPDFDKVDQKCKSGVHYDIAFDKKNDILYLYKKDYKLKEGVHKDNNGKWVYQKQNCDIKNLDFWEEDNLLISFDTKRNEQQYISKHCWDAEVFIWNRFDMMTIKNDKIASHWTKGRFNNFHGTQYHSYIDVTIPIALKNRSVSKINSVRIVGELIEHLPGGIKRELIDERLVERIMLYNGYQSTGWMSVRYSDEEDQYSTSAESKDGECEIKVENKVNGFKITKIKNAVPKGSPVFDRYNPEIKDYDNNYKITSVTESDTLTDDFVGVRMIVKKAANKQVILRAAMVDYDPLETGVE